MNYLLDTNTCIRFINGRSPKLREKNVREFGRIRGLKIEDWEV